MATVRVFKHEGTDMSDLIRTPFAMIPGWVITRVTDPVALRVYAYLAWKYADKERHAFPSEDNLATELGCGLRSVERAVRALRDADALLVTRSRRPGGYYGRNLYSMPMDDPRESVSKPSGDPLDSLVPDVIITELPDQR